MRRGSLTEAENECSIVLANFPRHYRALVLMGEILTGPEGGPDRQGRGVAIGD
jgi:hypothetical protein